MLYEKSLNLFVLTVMSITLSCPKVLFEADTFIFQVSKKKKTPDSKSMKSWKVCCVGLTEYLGK